MNKLVVIAGNVATGKTTLAVRLARTLGWSCEVEDLSGDLSLDDFYSDMERWALRIQLNFLRRRVAQHSRVMARAGPSLVERSILEDRYVFAAALHKAGYLTGREFGIYTKVFNSITKDLSTPDLIIHLHADPCILLERVAKRGRSSERSVTLPYLHLLAAHYREWIESVNGVPVINVDTAKSDVRNASVLAVLRDQMREVFRLRELTYFSPSPHPPIR